MFSRTRGTSLRAAPRLVTQRRTFASRVWVWQSSGGVMGYGAKAGRPVATEIEADSVTAGFTHSALIRDGRVYLVGSKNQFGELGASTSSANCSDRWFEHAAQLEAAAHVTDARKVALGEFHSAVITHAGQLLTWGWGGSFFSQGALGHGGSSSAAEPTLVDVGEPVVDVACGRRHTLALGASGTLYATGDGEAGKLGTRSTSDEPSFAVVGYFGDLAAEAASAAAVPSRLSAVRAGAAHSAVLTAAGEVYSWGKSGAGQLGIDVIPDPVACEPTPTLVRSLALEGHAVVQLASGENSAVALAQNGAVYYWGDSAWVEPRPMSLPAKWEDGISDIRQVVAGVGHGAAVCGDGAVYWFGKKSAPASLSGESAPQLTRVDPELFAHEAVVDLALGSKRGLAVTDTSRKMEPVEAASTSPEPAGAKE